MASENDSPTPLKDCETRMKNRKTLFMVPRCLVTVVIVMIFKLSSVSSLQVPTAYTTGGGGFITMTASMGIIRAWYESNILLENTTHFGGNSGGSWFQTQFSYSKEFYESAIGVTGETVAEFLSAWGAKYNDAMDSAVNNSQFEDVEYTIQTGSACPLNVVGIGNITAADIINAGLQKITDGLYFPVNNWYYYVNTLLSSYIPQSNTQLFSSVREGFPKGDIILASTLGPDAYQFDSSLKSPKLTGMPQGVTLLPISYAALEGGNSSWQFTAAINQTLEVSVKGNDTAVNLGTALPSLSISDIAAASSAVMGLAGSPTLFKQMISYAVKLPRFGLSRLEQTTITTAINTCLPLGLQNVSSPTEGNIVSSVSSWSPLYRHLDGCYTDNTAITHTVANMQKSCINDPSKYDCTQGLRLLNIFNGWDIPENEIGRLFANCDCGTCTYDYVGSCITPQIFSEEFSWDLSDPGWELYSNTTYPRESAQNPSMSYAWRGTVTTVENEAYGVRGGMKVDLVILFVSSPPASIIFPGKGANYAFSNLYSDMAQEQYASTLALFEKLNLADDWGTGSSQPASPSLTSNPTAPNSSAAEEPAAEEPAAEEPNTATDTTLTTNDGEPVVEGPTTLEGDVELATNPGSTENPSEDSGASVLATTAVVAMAAAATTMLL